MQRQSQAGAGRRVRKAQAIKRMAPRDMAASEVRGSRAAPARARRAPRPEPVMRFERCRPVCVKWLVQFDFTGMVKRVGDGWGCFRIIGLGWIAVERV